MFVQFYDQKNINTVNITFQMLMDSDKASAASR